MPFKNYEERKGKPSPDVIKRIYRLCDLCAKIKPKLEEQNRDVIITCPNLGYNTNDYLRELSQKC